MSTKKFPILYTKTATGKVNQWLVIVKKKNESSSIQITSWGQVNGKIQTNKKVVESPFEKAVKKAETLWKNKKKQGGVENMKKLENKVHVLPMVAKEYKKEKKKVTYPSYIQRKYDGVRAIMYIKNNKVQIMSRRGNMYCHLDHLRKQVILLIQNTGGTFYLDGELFTEKVHFQDIVSSCKKEKKISESEKKKMALIEYHVYDCFDLNRMEMTFEQRFKLLEKIFKKVEKKKIKNIILARTIKVNSEKDIMNYHREFIGENFEGTMIRSSKGKYKFGPSRSNDLLKLKPIQDDEFEIVGFTEGTGKDKGTIIFKVITKDGKEFRVRPMGTIKYRKKLFKEGKKLVGKMLTVEFNDYTKDGIPRFPRGKVIREYE